MHRSLNENIRELRRSFGYSQVDLARELNVSKQCVSNWENDNIQPSIDMLLRLSELFNVSTDYLLGKTDKDTVNVSGLRENWAAHIRLLINDLRMADAEITDK